MVKRRSSLSDETKPCHQYPTIASLNDRYPALVSTIRDAFQMEVWPKSTLTGVVER